MIGTIDEPYRLLSDIPEFKDFEGYAIGRSGTVYSLKQFRVRRLRPSYEKGKPGMYPRLTLKDKHKKTRLIYISKLVAAAFIPKDGSKCILRLKDKESNRYSADNLHYVKIGKFGEYVPKEIELSDDMIENIKKLYDASITKGIPNLPSDVNLFLEKVMTDSMNEYISRYGLRRLLM